MNPASSPTGWRLTLTISAILLIGAIGYSTHALVKAMRATDQPRALSPPPVSPDPAMPAAAPVPEPPPPEAAPTRAGAATDISATFDAMRKKEQDRKTLIENLRKQSRENPDAPGTLPQERIDKLEQSGDSLM